jgi:hypothetical protein
MEQASQKTLNDLNKAIKHAEDQAEIIRQKKEGSAEEKRWLDLAERWRAEKNDLLGGEAKKRKKRKRKIIIEVSED